MLTLLTKNKIKRKRAEKILEKFPGAEFFDRGRHAVILKNEENILKIEKDIPAASGAINDEARWLKRLKKYEWVPKLVEYNKELRYVKYRFVNGDFLPEFAENKNVEKLAEVVKKSLKICRELDKIGINKKEMHQPKKHIIIDYPKVTFIDWERCYETEKPQNVTQFMMYVAVAANSVSKSLKIDRKKAIKFSKEYKKNYGDEEFRKILNLVCQTAHRSS